MPSETQEPQTETLTPEPAAPQAPQEQGKIPPRGKGKRQPPRYRDNGQLLSWRRAVDLNVKVPPDVAERFDRPDLADPDYGLGQDRYVDRPASETKEDPAPQEASVPTAKNATKEKPPQLGKTLPETVNESPVKAEPPALTEPSAPKRPASFSAGGGFELTPTLVLALAALAGTALWYFSRTLFNRGPAQPQTLDAAPQAPDPADQALRDARQNGWLNNGLLD